MIVLPKFYRFKILNSSGVSLSSANVKVYARRFKFGSNGALSYESSENNIYSNSGSVSNSNYDSSSMIDNTTDLWIGGAFVLEVTTTGSPNGNVILFFERSTDGTTRVDTNGVGDVVAVLNFTAAGTKYKSFSL